MDLTKWEYERAWPFGCSKRGALSARGALENIALSAATGQVGHLGAAAMVMVTPLQNGFVLEAGSVRQMCLVLANEGRN